MILHLSNRLKIEYNFGISAYLHVVDKNKVLTIDKNFLYEFRYFYIYSHFNDEKEFNGCVNYKVFNKEITTWDYNQIRIINKCDGYNENKIVILNIDFNEEEKEVEYKVRYETFLSFCNVINMSLTES